MPKNYSKVWSFSEEEFTLLEEDHLGICLACHEEEIPYCESDLRKGTCPICDEAQVYGLGSLLLMGRISIDWIE